MNVTVRNPGEREYRIRKFVVLKSSVHQILPEIKKGRIWKYTHKINLHKENTYVNSQTGLMPVTHVCTDLANGFE